MPIDIPLKEKEEIFKIVGKNEGSDIVFNKLEVTLMNLVQQKAQNKITNIRIPDIREKLFYKEIKKSGITKKIKKWVNRAKKFSPKKLEAELSGINPKEKEIGPEIFYECVA